MKVIKKNLRVKVLLCLTQDEKTQKEIVETTGIPKSTVYDIINEFKSEGLLEVKWKERKTYKLKNYLSFEEIIKLIQYFNDDVSFANFMDSDTGEKIIDTVINEIKKIVDIEVIFDVIKSNSHIIRKKIEDGLPFLEGFDTLDRAVTCTCVGRVPPEVLKPDIRTAVYQLRSGDVKTSQKAAKKLLDYLMDEEVKVLEKEIREFLFELAEVFRISLSALKSTINLIKGLSEPETPLEHLNNFKAIVSNIIKIGKFNLQTDFLGILDVICKVEKYRNSRLVDLGIIEPYVDL